MSNILEIRDLVVSYGGIEAVKGISLDVEQGKIVTLIGANGAGKSTTLKAISGIVKPKSASIKFNGEELVGKSPDYIVSKGITLVPEGRRVFPNLTVLENLKIGAYLRKDKEKIKADIHHVYELFPRLKEREWQLAGTLSGGEQQMLAVGRALMSNPKLIMMDEPSLGLAPLVVKGIHKSLPVNSLHKHRLVNVHIVHALVQLVAQLQTVHYQHYLVVGVCVLVAVVLELQGCPAYDVALAEAGGILHEQGVDKLVVAEPLALGYYLLGLLLWYAKGIELATQLVCIVVRVALVVEHFLDAVHYLVAPELLFGAWRDEAAAV